VLEAQQPANRAGAEQRGRQRPHAIRLLDADGRARRIHHVGRDDELLRRVAEHEPLAAGDEHAQRAVVGRNRRHRDEAAQPVHEAVALVEQVVGRVAEALHRRDLLVDVSDALRDLVDAGHRVLQILREAGLQRVELAAGQRKTRGDLLRAREHDFARRDVLRAAREVHHRIEQLAGGVAQTLLAGGERVFEAHELLVARLVAGGQRGRHRRLAGEELVVRALDGDHVDALAEEAGAGELALRRRELDLLARVAGDAGVGDVVARGLQLRHRGGHRARAQAHQCGGHCVACLRHSACAARAASCR